MKQKALWRVSVRTLAEAEEAVAGVLGDYFGLPASSYTDLEDVTVPNVQVSVYLDKRPASWVKEKRTLQAKIDALGDYGLRVGSGVVSLSRVAAQDWAESWKRHFKPLEIAGKLLVKPSWSKVLPKRGEALLVLDPGLSFGTGQHPTTAFCLGQIVRRRVPGTRQSFLDVGTGSGILALAAAAMGYAPVVTFDNDEQAVRSAKENARRNGLQRRIRIYCSGIGEPKQSGRLRGEQYDLVCANLISDLLVRVRDELISRVAPGGCLVLAGVLRDEFSGVQQAYEGAKLRLEESRAVGEWRSGAFELADG